MPIASHEIIFSTSGFEFIRSAIDLMSHSEDEPHSKKNRTAEPVVTATEVGNAVHRQSANDASAVHEVPEVQRSTGPRGWPKLWAGRSVAADSSPMEIRAAITVHAGLLVISLLVLVLSIAMRTSGEEHVFLPGFRQPVPGTCVSKTFLGVECPGCGMTRCFISMGHGQLGRAWHFNPAGILFYAIVLAQVPWRSFQLFRLLTGRGEKWVGYFDWVMWLVAVLMLLQWATRPWLR